MISFLRTSLIASRASCRCRLRTPTFKTSFRLYCVKYVPPPELQLPNWYYNYLDLLPPLECSTLAINCLKVATMMRDTRTVCVGLFIDAGPKYENKYNNGISCFFEHIVFSGTLACNRALLEKKMNDTGTHFKAFTTQDMVGFYAECLSEDVENVIAIISECVYCNSFSEEAILKARYVIKDEMEQRRGDLDAQLYDFLIGSAFQGTPLANSVYGPLANLCYFTKETLSTFSKRYHQPSRTVLAACGGVTHELMMYYAGKYFNFEQVQACQEDLPYRYSGSEAIFRDDRHPMANLAIAVEATGFGHQENYALDVARELVGGWDRRQCGTEHHPTFLGQAVNEHHVAAYKSFHITFNRAGLWGIQVMCPTVDIENMLYCVTNKWMHICVSVTNLELEKAKSQLKLKMLLKAESQEDSVIDMAKWILRKGWMPKLSDRLRCVEAVSEADLRSICQKYIYDRNPVVASVGATALMPEYNRLRASLYWLRY